MLIPHVLYVIIDAPPLDAVSLVQQGHVIE